MSLTTKTVGSSDCMVVVASDPLSAANLQSILALGDAASYAGLFAALSQSQPMLVNAAGLSDRQRAAVGTTGIAAVNTEGVKATYSNAVIAFTPVATPTDFWILVGSATKIVRLLRLAISGFATAAISVDVQLVKRSTANTGGTPTSPAIALHDSNDGVATAVVSTYATNPTLGASAGILRAQKLNLGATGAAGKIEWDFSTRNSKAPVLRGVAQSYSLNWNGAAVPAGTLLNIECEFSEE